MKLFPQPLSPSTSSPGEKLRTDLARPLTSPVHQFVLTAADIFTKHLFGVLLTNVRADNFARELTSISFCRNHLPRTICLT